MWPRSRRSSPAGDAGLTSGCRRSAAEGSALAGGPSTVTLCLRERAGCGPAGQAVAVAGDQPVHRPGDPAEGRQAEHPSERPPERPGIDKQTGDRLGTGNASLTGGDPQDRRLGIGLGDAEGVEVGELPGHDLRRRGDALFDEPRARRAEGAVAVVDEDGSPRRGAVAGATAPSSAAAGVDDAEAVAVGVGENDEVGIVRVEVPADAYRTERDQAFHFRGLVGGVAGVEVEVDARLLLHGRLAELQRQVGAGTAGRDHDRPVRLYLVARHVVESPGPELGRPPDVVDTQYDGPDPQHAAIVAARLARRLLVVPCERAGLRPSPDFALVATTRRLLRPALVVRGAGGGAVMASAPGWPGPESLASIPVARSRHARDGALVTWVSRNQQRRSGMDVS